MMSKSKRRVAEAELDRLIGAGLPEGVLRHLRDRDGLFDDPGEALGQAQQAVDAAAAAGAGALVEGGFAQMLAFSLGLVQRLEFLARRRVAEWDATIARGGAQAPPELDGLLRALEGAH